MSKPLSHTCQLVVQDAKGKVLAVITPRHRADEGFVDRLNHMVSHVGGKVTVVEPALSASEHETIQLLTEYAAKAPSPLSDEGLFLERLKRGK